MPPRERRRAIVDPDRVDLHPPQPTLRRRTDISIVPCACGHELLADISARAHRHSRTIPLILINKSPIGARQHPVHRRAHCDHILNTVGTFGVEHLPRIGHEIHAKAGEQGRLP